MERLSTRVKTTEQISDLRRRRYQIMKDANEEVSQMDERYTADILCTSAVANRRGLPLEPDEHTAERAYFAAVHRQCNVAALRPWKTQYSNVIGRDPGTILSPEDMLLDATCKHTLAYLDAIESGRPRPPGKAGIVVHWLRRFGLGNVVDVEELQRISRKGFSS